MVELKVIEMAYYLECKLADVRVDETVEKLDNIMAAQMAVN